MASNTKNISLPLARKRRTSKRGSRRLKDLEMKPQMPFMYTTYQRDSLRKYERNIVLSEIQQV